MAKHDLSRRKKGLFILTAAVLVMLITLALGEFFIGTLNPQATMRPRREFSPAYGFLDYQNATIVHEMPGQWKFVYTTNQYRHRGRTTLISNVYDKPNIIVLGDSYTFGMGVNDGEEYASVMSGDLEDRFNVINLAVGGWGLTQQIRRYYEFGQLYVPKMVILQFSINDIEDNFNNKVTIIENDKFKFVDSKSSINWIKKYLSKSFIQKIQMYNLLRNAVYIYFSERHIGNEIKKYQDNNSNEFIFMQDFYIDLLDLFIKDLNKKDITILMISIENHLDQAEKIKKHIFDLDKRGLLQYIEVKNWLKNMSNYSSPEGHEWGKDAHYVVGTKLSEVIRRDYAEN